MALSLLGEDLDAKDIAKIIRKPGKHPDGGGLYLQVASPGQGSWVVRFGKRWKSLGPADEISADEARERRKAMWKVHKLGGDPFAVAEEAKKADEDKKVAEQAAEAARVPFGSLIEPYLTLNAPGWKGGTEGHEAGQYRKTLAGPLSALSAAAITSADVQKHLEKYPPARADKVRMRVMQVINYAVAKGLRADGENPARKEVMKFLVPSAPKSKPHKSMPVADVPEFMGKLYADGSPDARALAFAILTAARTAEARDARWEEISGKVWTIPGGIDERSMKESVEHSVPLSPQALALLGTPKKSGRVFGQLPHDALIDKVKEHGGDYTTHGFRTSFTGWAVKAKYSKDLRDRALAHAVGTKTDQAYDREELIEERRPMMQAWSDFACSKLKHGDELTIDWSTGKAIDSRAECG
ncbi:integrase arm-type DNA-binding domain-containing protein [Bradyrhizobium sp. Ash2021]|uniref:tyrosine-type recombinase/integrase n=1 Tax=Bradyrhizobium sp. Ash2021 TaxID=2954771 RepID=UPI002814F5A2|nr:integrase arm-type DNA-binding domain-containing protein [Bradyrhizobium sp. Ash2021]WMT75086.1 integrase arm-type DNA-binding domain-containing protein [Bradyrhizobium sp. Ash2021]